ncbi:alpha/beta fold hydrolase [Amycolatopsis sp. NPDC005232]|uniref:alpha/beta fold hydrolase n=1 Tax=Amycolatopsis sp. NPDC005232 TaxID=3157027 RepID=UPI0033B15BC8
MADTATPAPAGGAADGPDQPRQPERPGQRDQPGQPDLAARLRSPAYLRLLVIAAIIGVPISAAAYFFLQLVGALQEWVYTDLPRALGFAGPPLWWPVPPLVLCGLLVAVAVRYLPGGGGHSPVGGFKPGQQPTPSQLPGVLLAALATLGLGAVLGPEAPLIALGAGLGVCAVRLARPHAPKQVGAVVAATGSFAAISALLGSPILGAFLLMEASGLAGATMGLVLLPGLLAAGIGTLLFIGLDSLTGLGPASLALPELPPFTHPDVAQFGWALGIGAAAAVLGTGIRRLSLLLHSRVENHVLLLTPVAGLVIAGLAIAYTAAGGSLSDVLFSGETALPALLENSAAYAVPTLLLLLACKGLAYGVTLSAFRGGPVFPSMFLGAAGGIALSHLPGLPLVAGVAMGIGAMCVVMLRLPLTSVLLATLLLSSDGLAVMPLVIVAVVVAHVLAAWLGPREGSLAKGDEATAPATPVSKRSETAARGGTNMAQRPNIVLVHGAWADGSCWSAVIERLQADGYRVTAPQFPETSLAGDVARLRQVLARQDGPTIVAGHSYGGQIVTALGTDAPNVVGLVYVAAFGLDEGETIGKLLAQGPVTPALAHLDVDKQGFAWLPEDDFVNHFAADVDPVKARVMFAVQQPLALSALDEVMGVPAWKSHPAWFLVADGDQAIPPEAQRLFAARMKATTVEVASNHVAMVSHPDDVLGLIASAVQAVR